MKKFIFNSNSTNHQHGIFFFLVIPIDPSGFQPPENSDQQNRHSCSAGANLHGLAWPTGRELN
jgi:hypothetical protein